LLILKSPWVIKWGWVRVLIVAAGEQAAGGGNRTATDIAFRQNIQAEHSGRTFRQNIQTGELDTMDTSDFDKQAHQHLSIYNGVMTASKIVIGLVILTLVVMAATLL
jgi:cytidylate kinase